MPVRAGSDGHGRLRLLRPHHRVQRDRNPQTQQRPAMGSHADLPRFGDVVVDRDRRQVSVRCMWKIKADYQMKGTKK